MYSINTKGLAIKYVITLFSEHIEFCTCYGNLESQGGNSYCL